jgi:hypothetical protein
MCQGKPFKIKNQQIWWGVDGGEIVVPRPSASASLIGRRQKYKLKKIQNTRKSEI